MSVLFHKLFKICLQIEVCFDDDQDITLYTRHYIDGASVAAADTNPSRPSFQDDDDFYQTYDPDDCYSTKNQDSYSSSLGSSVSSK